MDLRVHPSAATAQLCSLWTLTLPLWAPFPHLYEGYWLLTHSIVAKIRKHKARARCDC